METAEQLMERGDFVGALRVLDGERRRGELPAHRYMMLFNLRTRLEEYPGALAGQWSTAGIPFPPSSHGFMQAAVLHAAGESS